MSITRNQDDMVEISKEYSVRGLKFPTLFLLTFCLIFVFSLNQVQAQPKSYLYISNTDEVLSDLNVIVEKIASEPKAWNDKLKPNIEIFLGGIDPKSPLLFEIQLDLKDTKYITSFPVKPADQKEFLNNLNGLGVKSRQTVPNQFQLRSAYDGFLIFNNNYAHISSVQADLAKEKLHDIPKLAKSFIEKKADLGYLIHNENEKLDERKDSFTRFSKKVLDNIVDRPKLSKEENVLAKLGIKQQLEEVQRYFVESEIIEIGWTTNAASNSGEGNLFFTPLEKTSLAESLKLVSGDVSQFQKVTSSAQAIVSGRSYFPLDEFRKKQFNDFYQAFRPVFKQRIEIMKKLNADQKQGAKEATDIFLDLLTIGTKMDVLDSFVEMQPDGQGLHNVVAGSRMIDSSKVINLLEALIKVDTKAELNKEKVSIEDLKFHELVLKENVPVGMQMLFGKTPRFLVGTQIKDQGKTELVLVAVGPSCEEDLKRIIEQINQPKDPSGKDTTLLSWKSSMTTVLKAIDAELLDNGRKDEIREVLVKSFSTKDGTVDSRLYLEEGKVKGYLKVDEGFLQAVGKIFAHISKAL